MKRGDPEGSFRRLARRRQVQYARKEGRRAVKRLRISDALTLPLEAVTQTFGIIAVRGAGKTYTASVMCEEMLEAGLQVVVLDPLGVWWGLRASADGKGPGLPIIVLGGEHADAPIEHTAGEIIADFVVDDHQSMVLDLGLMRKGQQQQFVTDFAERLYHRNRHPLHLFLDEADSFAPQKPMPGQQRMLGAVEDLVRRGRARGVGVTVITQRSAVLNKDVLTQVETLVAMRTISPQDMDAVDAWVKRKGDPERRNQFLNALPSLPIGTAWVWSPGWLGAFKQVRIRRRHTFDSSATPKVGQRVVEPKLAEVDLRALAQRIQATIERAKANDPRELRRRIADLEAQLRKAQAAPPPQPQVKVEHVEVPALKDGQLKRLEDLAGQLKDTVDGLSKAVGEIMAVLSVPVPAGAGRSPFSANAGSTRYVRPPVPVTVSVGAQRREVALRRDPGVEGARQPLSDDIRLGKAERLILTALAQYPQGRSVQQVALLTGYAVNGGAFRNALGHLRSTGRINGRGHLQITQDGLRALGPVDPLPPPGPALLEHWMQRVGHAEREILRVLTDVYPKALPIAEVAARATSSRGGPYEPDGGAFRNPLGRLRTLGIIEGRGEIKVADTLVTG